MIASLVSWPLVLRPPRRGQCPSPHPPTQLMITTSGAQTIVEKSPDQGFEAWRQLSLRFNPVGETYTFDKMNTLMKQPRCTSMTDLPAAIGKWELDVSYHEERTSKDFQEVMNIPVLMPMVPARDLEEVLCTYRLTPVKGCAIVSCQLLEFGNEMRY